MSSAGPCETQSCASPVQRAARWCWSAAARRPSRSPTTRMRRRQSGRRGRRCAVSSRRSPALTA
eukprot:7613281-Alexandrium_andersonii.AAC.1